MPRDSFSKGRRRKKTIQEAARITKGQQLDRKGSTRVRIWLVGLEGLKQELPVEDRRGERKDGDPPSPWATGRPLSPRQTFHTTIR